MSAKLAVMNAQNTKWITASAALRLAADVLKSAGGWRRWPEGPSKQDRCPHQRCGPTKKIEAGAHHCTLAF